MNPRQSVLRNKLEKWPQEIRDLWEERAAIMEYDGGETRERAEWMALKDITAVLAGSD